VVKLALSELAGLSAMNGKVFKRSYVKTEKTFAPNGYLPLLKWSEFCS